MSSEIPKFNYIEQEYFDSKGNIVEVRFDNFPCSRCNCPGIAQIHSVYYESYKCISCKHIFTVN